MRKDWKSGHIRFQESKVISVRVLTRRFVDVYPLTSETQQDHGQKTAIPSVSLPVSLRDDRVKRGVETVARRAVGRLHQGEAADYNSYQSEPVKKSSQHAKLILALGSGLVKRWYEKSTALF